MSDSSPEKKNNIPKQPFDIPKKEKRTTTVKRKVLIADDDELVRDSLRILIQKYGYSTQEASNGFEALELLDEEPFALLICDIRMPGINGIETVRSLRETARLEANRTVPVIFITGYCDSKLEKTAREAGYLAYLLKPFDDSQIWHLLKIYLGS